MHAVSSMLAMEVQGRIAEIVDPRFPGSDFRHPPTNLQPLNL
jgi:hypothetical protein